MASGSFCYTDLKAFLTPYEHNESKLSYDSKNLYKKVPEQQFYQS